MKGGRNNMDLSKDRLAIGRLGPRGEMTLHLCGIFVPWESASYSSGIFVTSNGIFVTPFVAILGGDKDANHTGLQ